MYNFIAEKHIFSNNSKSIGLRPHNTNKVEQKSGYSRNFGTIFMSLSTTGAEIWAKNNNFSHFSSFAHSLTRTTCSDMTIYDFLSML